MVDRLWLRVVRLEPLEMNLERELPPGVEGSSAIHSQGGAGPAPRFRSSPQSGSRSGARQPAPVAADVLDAAETDTEIGFDINDHAGRLSLMGRSLGLSVS